MLYTLCVHLYSTLFLYYHDCMCSKHVINVQLNEDVFTYAKKDKIMCVRLYFKRGTKDSWLHVAVPWMP